MKKNYIATASLLLFLLFVAGLLYVGNRTSPVSSVPSDSFTYLASIDSELSALCDGDLNQTAFFHELEKRTGIHVNWVSSLDKIQSLYQFNQSNSRSPDLMDQNSISTLGPGSLDEHIDNGMILDLTELLPEYAPNYNRLIQTEAFYDIAHTPSGRIGAIYALKQETQKPYAGLQIRKDWLDELNLSVPVTYEDWEAVLTAFKEKKGASAPLSLSSAGFFFGNSFNAGFDVSSGFFHIGNRVFYGPAENGWKEYLTLMHRWYEKGLIHPDFMTGSYFYGDPGMIQTGATGAWYGLYTLPSTLSFSSENSDAEVIAVKPPRRHKKDKLHLRMADNISDNYAVIPSDCKQPELVLRWIDYFFSEEGALFANYGTEGDSYTLNQDGNPQFTDLILNNPGGLNFTQALKYYTLPPSFASAYFDWKREWQAIPEKDIAMCDVWSDPDTDYLFPENMEFTAEEQARLSKLESQLSTCRSDYAVELICGITSFDNYDHYLEELKENGLEEALHIYQCAYDRFLSLNK